MDGIQIAKHFWQITTALTLNVASDLDTIGVLSNPLNFAVQCRSIF